MDHEQSLGLLVTFRDREWSAGPTYLKNIIFALRELPSGRQVSIKLLFAPDFADDMDVYSTVMPLVDGVEILDAGKKQADVLFPCMAPIIPPPPSALAGWIPDLQHKYLPDFSPRPPDRPVTGSTRILSRKPI